MRLLPMITFAALVLAPPFASGATPHVVVELFTSQGCSSCPPAEKLFSEIGRRPGVLALAYHVTYWDRLGWKDPFSFQTITDRQSVYAGWFKSDRIYTPQMIVNGTEEFVGSDRLRADAALAKATALADSLELAIERKPSGALEIIARVPKLSGTFQGQGRFSFALTESGLETEIPRGENAGLRSVNDFVARAFLESAPVDLGAGPVEARATLDASKLQPSRSSVVALLQESAHGAILAAAVRSLAEVK